MTVPANYEISEFSATLLLEPGIISNHHMERERNDIFLFSPLYLSALLPFSDAVNFSLSSSEFRVRANWLNQT